jgi:hypothetical protein
VIMGIAYLLWVFLVGPFLTDIITVQKTPGNQIIHPRLGHCTGSLHE